MNENEAKHGTVHIIYIVVVGSRDVSSVQYYQSQDLQFRRLKFDGLITPTDKIRG